jgi:TolA-binding protein
MPPHEPDWDDEERELLGSATFDSPPPGSRARTLAALGVTGAALGSAVVTGSAQAAGLASAGSSATTALATSSGKSLLVAKWLMLLAAAGAAGSGALYYRAESAPPAAPAPTAQAPALEPAARPASPTVEPLVSESTPVPATPAPAKLAPTQGASEPDIALEIELLDRARRASERRDFATALSELDRYDREHKQGRLRQEALLLRVQTLIGKGDRAAARALGERFLSRYPKSPLAPRMQKLIGS